MQLGHTKLESIMANAGAALAVRPQYPAWRRAVSEKGGTASAGGEHYGWARGGWHGAIHAEAPYRPRRQPRGRRTGLRNGATKASIEMVKIVLM